MVHHKIKLKEMKRDRFRQAVFQAYDQSVAFLYRNVRVILAGLAAVLVVVVAVVGVVSYLRGREADSRADLARALQLLPESSLRTLGGSAGEVDLDAAGDRLVEIEEEYGGYEGGTLALYYLGLVRLEQGRAEEAAAAAARFCERHPDHELVPLATWTAARAHARLGNAEEAVAAYRRIIEQDSRLMAPGLARLYLAQYLEGQGRTAEALEVYREVAEAEEEDGPWKAQAQRKVDQLAPVVEAGEAPAA